MPTKKERKGNIIAIEIWKKTLWKPVYQPSNDTRQNLTSALKSSWKQGNHYNPLKFNTIHFAIALITARESSNGALWVPSRR